MSKRSTLLRFTTNLVGYNLVTRRRGPTPSYPSYNHGYSLLSKLVEHLSSLDLLGAPTMASESETPASQASTLY